MSSCHFVILSKLKTQNSKNHNSKLKTPNSKFNNMLIKIKRYRYSPYGVDGMLIINGRTICATLEHPRNYLPAGSYPLELEIDRKLCRRLPTTPSGAVLRSGNGPFTLKNGSIIIGKEYIPGLVIKSSHTFDRLYERIEKNIKRRKGVVLTIV